MAVRVNGELIEDSVIRAEAERMRPRYEEVFANMELAERETQLIDWSRENVIERVVVRQEAQRRAEPVPPEQIEAAFSQVKGQQSGRGGAGGGLDNDELRGEIELQLRVERLLDEQCESLPELSEEAISEFYDKNKERYRTEELLRVGHIVKHIDWSSDEGDAREKMRQAQKELQKGVPFEGLVGRYSDCPENGGDLGYVRRGQMAEEFEDVVFNLDVGQVSDVFRTRFGFHIAKIYDRKPSMQQSLSEAKEQVIEGLKERMRRQAVESFVDRLKTEASIEDV